MPDKSKYSGFHVNLKDDGAEILLYGPIGASWFEDGISAKEVAEKVKSLDVKNLTVRINSDGGDVFEGVAIYNAIRRHKAKTTTAVDGLAASAASVVMLAGDERQVASNALIMIHDPWMMSIGNADELRKAADTLEAIRGTAINTYASRTSLTADEASEYMLAETWFDADEALEHGFATEVTGELKVAASCNQERWKYRNTPKHLLKNASPCRDNTLSMQKYIQKQTESLKALGIDRLAAST